MVEKIKLVLRSKLAQNSIWLVLQQVFNTVIPLLTLPYITRILSQSAYGEFSLALNWVGYFQVIVEYGFGLTGARVAATDKEFGQLKVMRSKILYARGLLMVISVLLLVIVAGGLRIDRTLFVCIAVLFATVVATVFQQNWLFQGMEDLKSLAMITIVCRCISVAMIFAFVKDSGDLMLYCALYASTTVISCIAGHILAFRKYNIGWGKTSFSETIAEIKNGWPLFVSSAMTKIFGSIGVTILGFVATIEMVGIYSAINKIPYVLTWLSASLCQALYPRSCRAFEDGFDCGVGQVKRFAVPMVALFGAGGIIIILLSKPIVSIIFGATYGEHALLLLPLIVWAITGMVNNFLGIQILVASGHQKEYSRAFTVSVVVMLALMLLLGYFWGVYGIASASVLSEMTLTVLLWRYVRRTEKESAKGEPHEPN